MAKMEAKDLAPIQPIILEDDGDLLLLAGTNDVASSAFYGVLGLISTGYRIR